MIQEELKKTVGRVNNDFEGSGSIVTRSVLNIVLGLQADERSGGLNDRASHYDCRDKKQVGFIIKIIRCRIHPHRTLKRFHLMELKNVFGEEALV